jgi:TP901 family phage tail tape measure protein
MADNYSIKYIIEAVDLMSQNMNNIKKGLNDLDDEFNKAAGKAGTFDAKMKKASEALKGFAGKMKWMSAGAGGIIGAGVVSFSHLEKAVQQVENIMTPDAAKKYNAQIKEVIKNAVVEGSTIEEAGKAMFASQRMLGDTEKALKAYNQAVYLSEGGNATLEESVNAVSGSMKIFSDTNAVEVANAYYVAQQRNGLAITDLTSALARISTTAKFAKMSFKDTVAVLSSMSKGMGSSEEAATAFESIFKTLAKPNPQYVKYFQSLGITTGINNIKQKGFATVLKQVRGAMDKNMEGLMMLIPGLRGVKGIAGLTDESLSNIGKTLNQLDGDMKSGSGMMNAYERNSQSMGEAIEGLQGSLKLMAASLGEDFSSGVKILSGMVQGMRKTFDNMDPQYKKSISWALGFTAMLAPMALGLSMVAKALTLVNIPLALFVGSMALVVAYWDDIKSFPSNWFSMLGNIFTGKNIAGVNIVEPVKHNRSERDSRELQDFLISKSMSRADVNVNLNAPRGVLKNYTSVSEGAGLNLGVNMGF